MLPVTPNETRSREREREREGGRKSSPIRPYHVKDKEEKRLNGP